MSLRRLGWPGLLGAVLLAAGLALLELGLKPLELQHADLVDRAREARAHAPAAAGLTPVSAAEARLASFYAFFRRDDLVTDHLARLHAFALQAGLELRVTDYRLAEARNLRLAEYTITMPLSGDYRQIRAFVERALNEIPVLTLDHASVRRKRAADRLIEAELRFTVFLSR